MGRAPSLNDGGPVPAGVWPQFMTIQEKGVTILNSKDCDKLYHKVSKVPSLVRVVDFQMVCAEDLDREHFCYVSTFLLAPSPPGAPAEMGGRRPEGRGGRRERWERREKGVVRRSGVGAWHERGGR